MPGPSLALGLPREVPYTIAMSRHRAGLAAAVCILIVGMSGSARAQDPPDGDVVFPVQKPRRPVAVIELGDFERNRELAGDIGRELNNHADLKPIDDAIAPAVLVEKFEDEDFENLDRAEKAKAAADTQIAAYSFPTAAQMAESGLERLLWVTPTPKVVALYAELAFILGNARLGEKKPKEASEAFRLARAVNPAFKPDAIRYLPEVVQAFETAIRTMPPGKGKISVIGEGRVVLDGREVGDSRAEATTWFDASAGPHVVWLVGPDREPRAKRVVLPAEKKEEVGFDAATLPRSKLIKRARLALKTAPDPAARAAAMQALAKLLEVNDAVLLTESNGKTIVQTWGEQIPGFSALREHKKDEKAGDLLQPLLPPKIVIPPKPPKPPKPFKPLPDLRAWYEKPRYQIAGGVVGAIAIGIVIYSVATWKRSVFNDENGQFEMRRAP
jgi:hypothetical protein